MSLVLHQFRYELKSFYRNPQSRFFTLALPIVLLVIFGAVFGHRNVSPGYLHGAQIKAVHYYVPALIGLGVIGAALVNLAVEITTQRETGILRRRRATPVAPLVLVAGRLLTTVVISLVIVVAVALVGWLGYGVTMPAGAFPRMAVTVALGAASFSCLAFAISTFIPTAEGAIPIMQAIALPLYFISGIFFSDRVPTVVGDIAKVFPIRHLAQALLDAFDNSHASSVRELAIVALWGIAGFAIALTRFSWDQRSV